jgi:hypothetical protein
MLIDRFRRNKNTLTHIITAKITLNTNKHNTSTKYITWDWRYHKTQTAMFGFFVFNLFPKSRIGPSSKVVEKQHL